VAKRELCVFVDGLLIISRSLLCRKEIWEILLHVNCEKIFYGVEFFCAWWSSRSSIYNRAPGQSPFSNLYSHSNITFSLVVYSNYCS
jgi:hypothetical protein